MSQNESAKAKSAGATIVPTSAETPAVEETPKINATPASSTAEQVQLNQTAKPNADESVEKKDEPAPAKAKDPVADANSDDAERKEEYGEAYYQEFRKRIGRALTGITSNKDSSIVPDAMLEALFSDSPKYRYRVGNDSKYLVTFLNWLHESTQDWVLSAGNTSNKSLPAAAPANGRQIATSRFASSWTRSVMALLMAVVGYRALRPRL